MSLILEALRKSEAERRRGQVPDLHAERPPAAQLARGGRPAWPWLLALAIVAVIVMAWLARDLWAPTPSDTTVAAGADNADAVSGSADTVVSSTDTVAPPAIEPPDAAPSLAEATPSPVISRAAPIEPAAVPPRRTEPAMPATRDTDTPIPTATPAPAPPTAALLPPPTKPSAPPPAPGAVPAEPDPVAAAVADTAPLHLSELTATERRGLPPLQVSMHMWAPTSAGRFAIIDGARVNEGDRLGDAVVDEITRDGVVLAWRGRRVQIPIH